MERARTLIIGAGISGLAFADCLKENDYLIVEGEQEMGGYCRTVKRDGFVWDYAGHFFHFRHPEIEDYLVGRMHGQRVLRIRRDSRIWYANRFIDFPFQKNIHQLPSAEYEECVRGLRERPTEEGESFQSMLYARYGKGIAEKFLIPYNEKLYATDLGRLDPEAMGRFFPHASVEEILGGPGERQTEGYNATFTYPEGGAIQYIEALAKGVRRDRIALGERMIEIDPLRKVATTTKRRIAYDSLVSSAPLIDLLAMCRIEHDRSVLSHNKVLVFNLGFDRKGPTNVHWIYYPQRDLCFYRVGFYDNIFGADRMSLYVEIGLASGAALTKSHQDAIQARVLDGLEACGVLTDQQLIASHRVVLDPAYVHITTASNAEAAAQKSALAGHDIHSIGRYGSWTYCSIEDNVVEARALAQLLYGSVVTC